ncbi:MAG: T9SS type A sorting domain-containing protein [Bacteroidales bacterium]|nr:T9SS type A sorting domain-containing protein [Bacteroidales bacterium]
MKNNTFLLSLCVMVMLSITVSAQFELTDLVDGTYPGIPWNAEAFPIPGDDIECWQFDKVDQTIANDSGVVAGSYWPDDPENYPQDAGQELRQGEMDTNYACFRYNGGAKVFRSSANWVRYTINCTDSTYYFFKFRSRQFSVSSGTRLIVTLETADSVNFVDSMVISNLDIDAIEIENLGLTSWYASKDSFLIPTGKHVIRIDIPVTGNTTEEGDGQGKFGDFTFISTATEIEIKKTYACGSWYDLEAIKDFPNMNVEGFAPAKIDGGNLCLSIDAAVYKDTFAAAQVVWDGPSGLFDMALTTLTEIDGESTYRVKINGDTVGTYKNPKTTTDYQESTKKWSNIILKYGDTIQVDFNSHTNGDVPEPPGTAYARGRWTKLSLLQNCDTVPTEFCSATPAFSEVGGVVVVEMEHVTLGSGWSRETSFPGYTGTSFIKFTASSDISQPTTASTMNYPIRINTPGTYRFKWRTKNGDGADLADQENDTWLKIEADDFYGTFNGNKTDCKDHWVKIWIHSMSNWSWNIGGEHAKVNGMEMYATFNNPGEYEIKIAGRSNGHVIDRMVLYRAQVDEKYATATNTPESIDCTGKILVNKNVTTSNVDIWNYQKNLVIEFDKPGFSSIKIVNLAGVIVEEWTTNQMIVEKQLSLPVGIYVVVVQQANTFKTQKIFVQ